MKYWKGITLLETMLTIAIVAVVTLASVHFYWQSKQESAVLQATSQVQRLVRASEQWKTAQRLPDFSGLSDNLVSDLVNAKLVDADDDSDPWGGAVSVTGNDDGKVIVRLSSVPTNSCQLLISRFKTAATASDFSCYGKAESETWEGQF